MISSQIIEEIKYRNEIEDVISGYITLKRAGSNFLGLCPFHSEKTPSFTVFTGSKSFYCFGCGVGGDVISFIMRSENLDYPDAVRFLAKRAGINVPEENVKGNTEFSVRRSRILDMNRDAAKFFFNNLESNKKAQEYIAKRGLSIPLVRHFGIGYALDDFQALSRYLSSKGYSNEEMKSGFLCSISKKNGKAYDIFRNRIMFPVIDVKGDIIAFGGRTIGNDPEESKYINSSDTPVFNKRRNLFALNFARTSCAEQIILCEGYMDVVSLHGAGITNAVASCGTALTPDQARLMRKYSKSAIISYDSDEAGQRAADKAFSLLGEVGLEARLLKVENAKDPDEYIKKYGKDAFNRLLNKSRSKFEFKFENIINKYNISTVEGKVKAASETANMISEVLSDVERDVYIRQASKRLDVPYESMKNDVNHRISKRNRTEKKEQNLSVIRAAEGYGDRINPDRIKNVGAAGAEDAIIGILTLFPELISKAVDEEGDIKLSADDFITEFNKRVFKKMQELGACFDVGIIGEEFNSDEISRIIKNTVQRQGLTENGLSVLKQCVDKLKNNKEKMTLEELIERKRRGK